MRRTNSRSSGFSSATRTRTIRRAGVSCGLHLIRGIDNGDGGSGQDVDAEVTATFDSAVVLLGQHGAARPNSDTVSRSARNAFSADQRVKVSAG